jgi:hypothetical protein
VQVSILRRRFEIYDADEYALKFMEEHPEMFPESNIALVLVLDFVCAFPSCLFPYLYLSLCSFVSFSVG